MQDVKTVSIINQEEISASCNSSQS